MATRKRTSKKSNPLMEETFQDISLDKEMEENMRVFAEEAISRAFPDIRDGLKNVQRRVLYAMIVNRMSPKSKHTKMSKVVGLAMAYHPHGDSSIFDTSVRMSQDWKWQTPLLDIEGNKGSNKKNNDWAASRYIEGRLSENSELFSEGLKQNAVDFKPSEDSSDVEPVVLPAQFPALLTNGAEGVGIGYSTKIIPHNPVELIRAAKLMNKNPDVTLSRVMTKVKGPDFPSGGIIYGKDAIKDIYREGKGKVTVRGRATIEGNEIIITEIPFGTYREEVISSINSAIIKNNAAGSLLSDGAIDESSGDRTKITIEVSKKVDPENILNMIYRDSILQTSFSALHQVIMEGKPQFFSLIQYLQQFLIFRGETLRRTTEFDRSKKRERKHIVEGFIKLDSVVDEVVKKVRASSGKADAIDQIKKMGFSDRQAEAIASLQIHRLSKQDVNALREEDKALSEEIEWLTKILTDDGEFSNEIERALDSAEKRLSGVKRKSTVEDELPKFTVKRTDFVEKKDLVVVVKPDGVQSMTQTVFDNNHDKWNGTIVSSVGTDTTKGIAMLTKKGKVIQRMVSEITNDSVKNPAEDLHKTIDTFSFDDEIIDSVVFDMEDVEDTGLTVVSVTKRGQVKRSLLSSSFLAFTQKGYLTRTKPYNGLKVAGDEVIWVRVMPTEEAEKLTLKLRKTPRGRITRVNVSDLSIQGGAGSGVRGITMKPEEELIVET